MKLVYKTKVLALLIAMLIAGYQQTKACTPLVTPVMTQTAIVGNNLLLNMTSNSIWMCPGYNVQVELVCAGNPFPGVAPFYYTSPAFTKTAAVQPLPQMTVSLNGLCAGGVYQYRWRETYMGFSPSPWSVTNTFTMPGVPIPTTLIVTATPSAICWPQTSQLTASVSGGCGNGTANFTWTPAVGLSCVTCSNPIANPTTTTIYTVTAGGSGPASCWSASTTITIVSFTAVPTVGTASAIPNLCAGQSNQVSISSSSGLIQWQQSINGAPFVDVVGATGTTMITPTLNPGNYCYRMVAVGCGGSVTGAPVCTSVTPTPTISVNTASMCYGQTLNIVGVGAQQFTWPVGIGQTGPTTGTTSPLVTTAFTATGTTNGCSSTAVITITVQAYPVVNLNSNSPVCIGNPININNTGIGTYNWTGPNSFTSNVQNPVIAVGNPSNNGVYNVSVDALGCVTTGSVLVTVLDPTVSATNSGTYCADQTIFLFANSSPVSTYNWSGPNAYASNAQNPVINNAQVAASGIYTVVVSDGFCTSSSTTAVLVNPSPTPALSSNAPVCQSTSLTIDASGAVTYFITGPLSFSSTSANNVISPASLLAAGIYSVAGTDANGCTRGATLSVAVLPSPSITVTGAEVCLGNTASLTSSGGGTYSWAGPNGFTSNTQNIFFNNLTAEQTGTYVVTITGANGCAMSAGTTLTVFPVPQPSASCDPVVCIGGKVSFEGSGGFIYNWIGPNGFVSHEKSPVLNAVNSLSATGIYTLGVIDDKGCRAYTTTSLTVKPLPTATITADLNNKCMPFCATYSINSASQLQTTVWNMNNTGTNVGPTFNYCFTKDGSRVLRSVYTDNNGCVNSATYSVNVYPIPKADFHFGPGDAVENDQIDFSDASLGPDINKWEWYFAATDKNAFYQNPSYTFHEQGAYPVTLIISNKYGCKDTVTKAVVVGPDANLFIPNIFTPNGDGNNDVFQPKGFGIVNYKMEIFDRWGVRIFATEDFATGWDGSVKGKISKDETFVYKITTLDVKGKAKEYTGHVSILK